MSNKNVNTKTRYYLNFLIFIIFIYLLNPIVTEFSQSGGVLIGLQEAKKNLVFHFYTLEFSSQFVLSSLILIISKSPLLVEFFGGLINVIIANFALLQWVKFFDEKFKEKKNNNKIYFIIIIFNILHFTLNLSYPIKFPLSYSIFGNSGMWLAIMILGMILRNNLKGYFFFGILLSWHLVWASLLLICLIPLIKIFSFNKEYKKKLLLISIGFFISLIFYFIFKILQSKLLIDFNAKNYFLNLNNFYNIFKPKILTPMQLSYHNIALNDYFSFIKILFVIFFGLVFVLILNKKNIELIFYKKIIISFGVIGFILTFYVALASYIPLIGSDFLARIIPNRIFNFLIVLNTILVCYFLLFQINVNQLKNKKIDIEKIIALSWLIIAHKTTGIAIVLIFIIRYLLESWRLINKINTVNFLFTSILILTFALKLIFYNRYYFTIYDYLFQKDEIILSLKKIKKNDSLILIGSNVSPPFNIYLSTPIEYIPAVNLGQYFYDINEMTKCKEKVMFNFGFNLELDWDCLKKVEVDKWQEVNKVTNITHILLANDGKKNYLKITKIAETKKYQLYSLIK